MIDDEMKEVLKEDEDIGLDYRDPSRSYYDEANYNRLSQINMRVKELVQDNPRVQSSIRSIGTTRSDDLSSIFETVRGY